MRKTSFLSIIAIAGAMLFNCGCDSFEYSGQNFPELPEESFVRIYWKEQEVDHDQYRMVGKGIYIVRDSLDRFDIEENLSDYARSHGADAVSVVKINSIVQGLRERNEVNFDQAVQVDNKKDPDATKEKDEVFGEEVPFHGEEYGVSKREIFVHFWKNKAEADQMLAERDKQLEKRIEGNWKGDK